MTRLVPRDVRGLEDGLPTLDRKLIAVTRSDLRGLAAGAARVDPGILETRSFAVVPLTCGQGRIDGFSEAVASIIRHVGGSSWVTEGCDASGAAEALEGGADVLFMADDRRFVALDLTGRRTIDNALATAVGFVHALDLAGGPVAGRNVLVIGAGPVGREGIRELRRRGATVLLAEQDRARRDAPGTCPVSIEEGLRATGLVLNASPAAIEAEQIRPGSIISSPGVPYGYDPEAEGKATIIHDPLPTGVAVMAFLASGGRPATGR